MSEENSTTTLLELQKQINTVLKKVELQPVIVNPDNFMRTKAFQKISKARALIEEERENMYILKETLFVLNKIDRILTFSLEDIK